MPARPLAVVGCISALGAAKGLIFSVSLLG